MSDIEELKHLFSAHIIKMIMFIIIIFIIIFVLDYFNLFNHMKKQRVIEEAEEALKFKGFSMNVEESKEVESEIIDKSKNAHMLIYGASGSGKTFFVKRYLEKNNISNYKVMCLDKDEWEENHIINEIPNVEQLKDHTLILDDQAKMKLDDFVSQIISKGRHFNIQLIFLAHLSTDLNPKSRNNVKEIFITTNNSNKFFYDLKEKFMLSYDLSRFKYIDYGVIRYNLYKDTFIVYDKNYQKVYDSASNIIKSRSDLDFSNFVNKQSFSELEKSEIKHYLENLADINITDELFLFYLNYYLIQRGHKIKLSKLKYMLSDYYEENKSFQSKNIIPLAKKIKDGYNQIINK